MALLGIVLADISRSVPRTDEVELLQQATIELINKVSGADVWMGIDDTLAYPKV